MRKVYRTRFGSSLPARFELVDVSLLNWFTDAQALQVEQKYFRQYPARGRFIHHAIYGALSSPDAYPDTIKDWLEVLPSMGEINDLQDDLGHMISTVQDRPQMVVVHCRAGHDRTGEVIAAYQMRYLGMSYREAYAKANAVAKRPLNPLSRYGLMWYAYYLKDVLGISSVGDIE
nr:dual specificity protein phosphatase family protein [Kistimonas asteriae]